MMVVRNDLQMNNEQRFINIALGYSIQADRIIEFVQKIAKDKKLLETSEKEIKTAENLMKRIRKEVSMIEKMRGFYVAHIDNQLLVKFMMQIPAMQLEAVINETDELLGEEDGAWKKRWGFQCKQV